jgi:hypothetical protein
MHSHLECGLRGSGLCALILMIRWLRSHGFVIPLNFIPAMPHKDRGPRFLQRSAFNISGSIDVGYYYASIQVVWIQLGTKALFCMCKKFL